MGGSRVVAAGAAVVVGAVLAGPPYAAASEGARTQDEPPEELVADLQAALDEAGADLGPLGEADAASLLAAAAEASTGAGLDAGGGSSLTGPCLGMALSLAGDGSLIDAAADFDPGAPPVDLMAEGGSTQAFTASNPYKVDFGGSIIYAGRYSGGPPLDHTWYVRVYGANVLDGGDDNPDGKATSAGTVDLGDDVPAALRINGLLKADGRFAPAGLEPCVGAGFVEATGGAPIAQAVGAVLAIIGGVGLATTARPRRA